MTRLPNQLIAACLCVAALAFGAGSCTTKVPPARGISPQPAPNFSVQDLDGQTINRALLQGKIVIINFWSVWSPACAREIPELIQLRESFGKNRERLAIVGICLESKNLGDIREFAAQLGVNYPVVIQETSFADQFGGIDAIPSTFIIDSAWNLVNRYTGKMQREELHYELSYMLEEQLAAEKSERERAKGNP